MTLTQLQEKITNECPYYRGGTEHRCNERLAYICLLFEDDGLPVYCRHFEKIADISRAGLDQIWKSSKKKKGEKRILKIAIIIYLLEKGKITQEDIIRQNLISERKLKYHWPKLMSEFGLKCNRGNGQDWRYKVYTAGYREKRELKRVLKRLRYENS